MFQIKNLYPLIIIILYQGSSSSTAFDLIRDSGAFDKKNTTSDCTEDHVGLGKGLRDLSGDFRELSLSLSCDFHLDQTELDTFPVRVRTYSSRIHTYSQVEY
jgi:hypothetical protein